MNARTQTIFAEPNFAKSSKTDAFDISEILQDQQAGEEGFAYMRCTLCTPTEERFFLEGIRIDESHPISLTTWHDRQDAIKMLGADAVAQIEAEHSIIPGEVA